MKKTITLCLLILTLFTGGMSVDAKTTKKKAAATSTTLTFKKFVKEPKNRGPYTYWNEIALKASGYKYVGTEIRYNPEINDDATYTIYKKSNGSTVTDMNFEDQGKIIFEFATEEEKNIFIKGWQKMFTKESDGEYISDGAHDQVKMTIKGNTVTLKTI